MDLWLLHADTPYRMLYEKRNFHDPALHIHEEALRPFRQVVVCFAFFSDPALGDDAAWRRYRLMHRNATKKLQASRYRCFYAIEDARILCGVPPARLLRLRADGVRILTPLWRDESPLGGGHATQRGLTREGERILREAAQAGLLLDVSHASRAAFSDLSAIAADAQLPLLATHSNFAAVCPHTRNLTDDEARRVNESGGIIGLSFVPQHVGAPPDIPAFLAHIEHGIALGISDALAIGGDLDGTDALACSLSSAADLATTLYPVLSTRYGSHFAQALFFGNAARRLSPFLPVNDT